MPELPEVETMKRDLEYTLKGVGIEKVIVRDARVLGGKSSRSFCSRLKGRKFESFKRFGKSIIIETNSDIKIFVQVRMTGYFDLGDKSELKETKIVFKLSNGKYLNYNDQRVFGRVIIFVQPGEIPYFGNIGPDPLTRDFTFKWLQSILKNRTASIKSLLLNQYCFSGVGNIYASEILFAAGVHPDKAGGRLSEFEVKALHSFTKSILSQAIKLRGTTIRNYKSSGEEGKYQRKLKVYGREDFPCVKCGQLVKRIVQSARSTFYCLKCQAN